MPGQIVGARGLHGHVVAKKDDNQDSAGASDGAPAASSKEGVAGPPVIPGASIVRHAHGLRFVFRIDQVLARVTAELKLGASEMRSLEMTHARPVAPFELSDGGMSATGSLMARFAAPPRKSAVQGDFEVDHGDDLSLYRGDIVVWDSPEKLILDRFSTFVAPTLEVRVELGDSTVEQTTRDPTLARVRLLYVNQIIYEEIVSSTKIMVQMPALHVGAIEIDEKARILYRPATVRQSGQVTLNITGRDVYGTEFQWDGAIANWDHSMVRPGGSSELPHGFEAEPPKLIALADAMPAASHDIPLAETVPDQPHSSEDQK